MSKKKILIIGGTGFIGKHLAKNCKKKNWKVTSISSSLPKKSKKIDGVKYIKVDIRKKKQLSKKLFNKNFDYAVNLAGYVDHSNFKETYSSHYLGCKNLVDILSKQELKSFLQMGSSSEYGVSKSPISENFACKPKSVYGKSKLLASKFLLKTFKLHNFPVIIFRLFQTYGPSQAVNRLIPITIHSCLSNKFFDCSSGLQYRDFVHIEDLIKAIFLSLNNKKAIGQIINIGCGKPIKVKNIIYKINKIIKKGHPKFGKIKMRKDESKVFYANIKKANKILGWKPKIKFNNGLKSTIKNYARQKKR